MRSNPRSTQVGRRGAGAASSRSGQRSSSRRNVISSSSRASGAPRQKCRPMPKPTCGFGSRPTSSVVGIREHELVAVRRPHQAGHLLTGPHGRARRPRRRPWRCARTAAAGRRSGSAPRGPSPSAPTPDVMRSSWSGWVSSACAPLPKTFTDASWPALSSRTTDATSSSSLSRLLPSRSASRSLMRSSPGWARRSSTTAAHVVGERDGCGHAPRRGRRLIDVLLVHVHDRLRPGPQLHVVGARHAEEVGDDVDRQRLGVLGQQVDRAGRVEVVEQSA